MLECEEVHLTAQYIPILPECLWLRGLKAVDQSWLAGPIDITLTVEGFHRMFKG